MGPSSAYTASCWRDGGAWVVHVPELGRSAGAGRLSQVEAVARDLVATYSRDDPVTARVLLDMRVPDGVLDLLTAAAAAREEPDRMSLESVTLRRGLARQLTVEGFAVRDVAGLLGVSYGGAQQLIGEGSRSALASSSEAWSTAPPERARKPHNSYQHEAFLYAGRDDFLAGTVPFVREGVSMGQPVMVAVSRPRLDQLRSALGTEGESVHFVDMVELGHNPARIIPGWRSFVDEHAGRPVRGIGEPIWAGRRPSELVECQLHEALLNLAVEPDTALWLRCPYDTQALDVSVLEEALHSHPTLVEADTYRGSTEYGGSHHVGELFARALPEPPEDTQQVVFAASELAGVRRLVSRAAIDAGLDAGRAKDVTVAVTEIATNSVRHGGGTGRLRVWLEPDALVCEVTDRGHIEDLLVGRRLPELSDPGGRGVWLANHLCDLVQIRSTPAGTAVRLHTWL